MKTLKNVFWRIVVLALFLVSFMLLVFLTKNDGSFAGMWKDSVMFVTTGKVS